MKMQCIQLRKYKKTGKIDTTFPIHSIADRTTHGEFTYVHAESRSDKGTLFKRIV